jgi:hypothetical protein
MSSFGVDLHGVGIGFGCKDDDVLDAYRGRFRAFPRLEREADVWFETVFVHDEAEHVVGPPPAGGRRIYEPPEGSVRYYDDEDVLYVDLDGRLRMRCDPARGTVIVSALDRLRRERWLLSRPMLTIPLVETLKRRGLYAVHAAGVTSRGRGILIPGASGAGKSTLALALARRGLGFLADDMVFLRLGDGGVEVLAFPDEIDLTPASASFLDGLPLAYRDDPPPGWKKHRVRVDDLVPAAARPSTAPAGALVFAAPSAAPRSAITEVGLGEALRELAPNVLLTESGSAQRHLDAIGALARASACYRLRTGRDFDRLADVLPALVA